jgi:hypothetical protein
MALPRKHNLEQLKKLRAMTKGQDIGDIVAKGEKKPESMMPNAFWIDNPIDRNIDTYEGFIKKDNKLKMDKKVNEQHTMDDTAFILFDNYLASPESIDIERKDPERVVQEIIKLNRHKYDNSELNTIKGELLALVNDYRDEYVSESVYNRGKGPGNNDFFNNNFKQVLTSQLSPSILQIGKFVKVGKIEGIIDSVDNDFVYISNSDGVEKVPYKKFLKSLQTLENIDSKSGLPSEFWTVEEYQSWPDEDDDIDVMEPEIQIDEPEIQIDEDEEEEIQIEDLYDFDDTGHGKPIPRRKPPKPGIRRIGVSPRRPGVIEKPDEFPYHPGEPHRRPGIYGTEDNPLGLPPQQLNRRNENVYIDEDKKKVKCDDCGQMVIDTYDAKIAHIYNKHFYIPQMDGSTPTKIEQGRPVTWPYGGKVEQKLVNKYFPTK